MEGEKYFPGLVQLMDGQRVRRGTRKRDRDITGCRYKAKSNVKAWTETSQADRHAPYGWGPLFLKCSETTAARLLV